MANVVINQEGVPENLRKQLSVAVRSIQWSYAIFWSLSTTQQGVLQWGDGYYNGDIKTRKTFQTTELKADKIGLQRSEQLRELYESLLEGEADQTKRPSAALSPEDLSDAEWYYLVCMSFLFNPGQDLPGRALANGETIWLCNAQYADSKIFSRSLLAKSASIQTVVCFPYLGGVIELGVTELVPEDLDLIQHIKASLLDFSKPVCSEKSSSAHDADDESHPLCVKVDQEIVDLLDLENLCSPTEEIKFDQEKFNELPKTIDQVFNIGSPEECSNGCEQNHLTEDSFMLEGVNVVASQVRSWHFMDDDFSNDVQNSINSSDDVSEAFTNQGKAAIASPKRGSLNHSQLKELREVNHTKVSFLFLEVGSDDDLLYRRTLSAILGTSNWLTESQGFHTCGHKSSFMRWKKRGTANFHRPRAQQKIIKKILFAVPLMHSGSPLVFQKENGCLGKSENNDAYGRCLLPEKRREEEKLLVLRSMVPSFSEIDKASILNNTIKYLKELEARVEELESCMDSSVDFEARPRRNCVDVVEQTSDNYENRRVANVKKSWINKRKASDIDESHGTASELNTLIMPKDDLTSDVKVSMKEEEVVIEIRCPSREYLLLDIIEAINNLHMDAHTVQSSTVDGLVIISLKSKFRGAAIAPAGMIKQALEKVAAR